MYFTIKQRIKHLSKEDYKTLRYLCRLSKNLHNEAIYNIRQYYFMEKEYLKYPKNYHLLKNSKNYKMLNSNIAQQILRNVDTTFQSFFALIKMVKKGNYEYWKVNIPNYMKKDGYNILPITLVRLKENILTIPYSYGFRKKHKNINIRIPDILKNKTIKEIRIVPKADARYFEIHYIYKYDETQNKLNLDYKKAIGIDFGINNLATCVTNTGESFIIDGRKLKSINQGYNKKSKYLQKIKDKQKFGYSFTKRQKLLSIKRYNQTNDYLQKSVKIIIDYCLKHNIGNIVCGYNESFQMYNKMGKINNQNLVYIPFGRLREKIEKQCYKYGINFINQEESYTSVASFFDQDEIPVYKGNSYKTYKFSGKRIKRGLYRTKNGYVYNADCNGALNILCKSKVVDLTVLYSRGELDTPNRIRII